MTDDTTIDVETPDDNEPDQAGADAQGDPLDGLTVGVGEGEEPMREALDDITGELYTEQLAMVGIVRVEFDPEAEPEDAFDVTCSRVSVQETFDNVMDSANAIYRFNRGVFDIAIDVGIRDAIADAENSGMGMGIALPDLMAGMADAEADADE